MPVRVVLVYEQTKLVKEILEDWPTKDSVKVECTEEQWRAMPESHPTGRRCDRCTRMGPSIPGIARFYCTCGKLCRWCAIADSENHAQDDHHTTNYRTIRRNLRKIG